MQRGCGRPVLLTVVAMVHSRLDYCNAVPVRLPGSSLSPACFQSVLNAAARLIYCSVTRDRILDALVSLHWLRVPESIVDKKAALT